MSALRPPSAPSCETRPVHPAKPLPFVFHKLEGFAATVVQRVRFLLRSSPPGDAKTGVFGRRGFS